jgi:hypothetical protein
MCAAHTGGSWNKPLERPGGKPFDRGFGRSASQRRFVTYGRSPMRLFRNAVICAVLFASSWPSAPIAAETEFVIRFGIIQVVRPHQFKLMQETTRLPRLTRAQGLVYGVEITPRQSVDYEVYFVARLPAPPKQLSGLASGIPAATAVSGFKTAVQRGRGASITPFWFDEGDPLGRYSLEVFVNGQSRGVIEYDVVAPR